ncbi:Leucine carboxyl methyltransferase 2 [Tieghemiomyces parasiticus]|uniref:tRNA wybutosine-synthesizing protein 4 n=1 Tax=Tieghemiomyces parasiticus TaxID=78921 RepID=A0A9W8DXW0_9FUNG|nr:Leucine carboxyl methyltransferase 2 [Tieghemiomyces parasiticus]
MPSSKGVISDLAVQGTNDNSIVSKRSADRVGYFHEEQYLKNVVRKHARRAPLINVAYFARSLVMDYFVSRFLRTPMRTLPNRPPATPTCTAPSNGSCNSAEPTRVIVLDPTYFRLKARGIPSAYTVIDIDFPDLVKRKSALIRSDPELTAALAPSQPQYLPSGDIRADDYHLIGCDLKQVDALTPIFQRLGITATNPILFISEVALVYMDPVDADAVIRWAAKFPLGQFVMYEQTVPTSHPTAFSATMVAHFNKMRSPLKCLRQFPTLPMHEARFADCGWRHSTARSLADFWDGTLTAADRRSLFTVEPFDEWEEWHMNAAHYFVLHAINHPEGEGKEGGLALLHRACAATSDPMPQHNHPGEVPSATIESEVSRFREAVWRHHPAAETGIQRWGHASAVLSAGHPSPTLLTFGGYGTVVPTGRAGHQVHQRLGHIVANRGPDWASHLTMTPSADTDGSVPPSPRIYHRFDHLSSTQAVLFGGRAGPLRAMGDVHLLTVKEDMTTWTRLHPGNAATNGDANGVVPAPRYRHASCVIPTDGVTDRPQLLVHGGCDARSNVLDDLWLFDPTEARWRALFRSPSATSGPGPRHSHTLTYVSGEVWLIGGLTADGTILDDVYRLDLASWSWTSVAASSPIPFAGRYGHCASPLPWQPRIVLVAGGISRDYMLEWSAQFMLFDTMARKWYSLPVAPLPRGGWWMLAGFSMVWTTVAGGAGPAHRLVLVGGGATCLSFGSHLNDGALQLELPW